MVLKEADTSMSNNSKLSWALTSVSLGLLARPWTRPLLGMPRCQGNMLNIGNQGAEGEGVAGWGAENGTSGGFRRRLAEDW